MSKLLNLSRKRFGRLLVKSENGRDKQGRKLWLCKCDCGNFITVASRHLVNGKTQSCGCLQKELTSQRFKTHGLTKDNKKLNSIWHAMKSRCENPSIKEFNRYGGRGIKVCDEWRNDFKKFYDWAILNGYREGLSIDRINNDGNYEPSNCQWISRSENAKKAWTDRKILG